MKTTQPRRYLVKPNQGLLNSKASVEVTIVLVDKDHQILLQNYDKLGFSQEALDAATKDKFLVQSCAILSDFSHLSSNTSGGSSKEEAEELTKMWNVVSSTKSTDVVNKKLLVRHKVAEGESVVNTSSTSSSTAAAVVAAAAASKSNNSGKALLEESNYAKMSPEMLVVEVTGLRRKYEDLVMFSVNLTAERDILNNTLEQTRRDLEKLGREKENINKRKNTTDVKSGGFGNMFVIIIAIIMFFLGKKSNFLLASQNDDL